MTVKWLDGRIMLQGRCRVEDAEALLSALQQHPDAVVQLDTAETIHSAIIQVLLAGKPRIEGISKHNFLTQYGILEDGETNQSSNSDD